MNCRHPNERRSLLRGYDVVCDDCEQIIGRVALFPCAVLDSAEANALLLDLGERDRLALTRAAVNKLRGAVA